GENAVGHETRRAGAQIADLPASEVDILTVQTAQSNDRVVLIHQKTGEGAAIGGRRNLVHETLADFGAGIDDAGEQCAEIVPLVGREVGANVATLVEKR